MTFQEVLYDPIRVNSNMKKKLETVKYQKANNLETEEQDLIQPDKNGYQFVADTERKGYEERKKMFDQDEDDEVNFSFDKRDQDSFH